MGAETAPLGAAWGAVTGPAWAIAMSILISLAGGLFHGDADGGSVFGLFLLFGALLGAGGGVLAVSDARLPETRPPRARPTPADLLPAGRRAGAISRSSGRRVSPRVPGDGHAWAAAPHAWASAPSRGETGYGGPRRTRSRIVSSGPRNHPSASIHHVSPARS